METVFWVSYGLTWALLLLLAFVVVVLARQIGLLNRRFPPYGARLTSDGPAIGEPLEQRTVPALDGTNLTIATPEGKQSTLITFISPSCSSCVELLPGLRSLFGSDRADTHFVVVSVDEDEDLNRRFVRQHRLGGIPYAVAPGLAVIYGVAGPPYAVLIDRENVVMAKGVVNGLEHLESLILASEHREEAKVVA